MGIFGFNLPYSNEMIEMAENQIGMSKEEIKRLMILRKDKRLRRDLKNYLKFFWRKN